MSSLFSVNYKMQACKFSFYDISKYNFEIHQVKYLGLIIQSTTEGG